MNVFEKLRKNGMIFRDASSAKLMTIFYLSLYNIMT